jgi:hypothetical protein
MYRFAGMNEVAWSPGGSQRGGDLLSYNTSLSHACDQHTTAALQQSLNRIRKCPIQVMTQAGQRVGLNS